MLKKQWPVLIAVAVLSSLVAVLLFLSLKQNDGRLVYALDDAYIHMAMAKNMARHGVWGVTSHAFSPSSSSILWTLTLSFCYLVFGTHETIPFILNLICALLILVLLQRLLGQYELDQRLKLQLLLCVILFTPLPVVVFVGMEHAAQILLDLLFIQQAARVLAVERAELGNDAEPARRDWRALLLLAALVPLIRYEGLFLIAVVCSLLLLRGRVALALACGAAAVLPITVFGLISVHQGAYWLPNSVLLKSTDATRGPVALFNHALAQVSAAPYLWQLLLLAATLYAARFWTRKPRWEREQSLLLIFILTTILHLTFSLVVVWFYRYEAYLVTLGIFACGVSLRGLLNIETFRRRNPRALIALGAFAALLLTASLFTLAGRSLKSLRETPRATTNVYQQQYQMGQFLRAYYHGVAVAANDVGAINYLAEIECLDLWGLATTEVARAKLEGKYDTRLIRLLAQESSARIAIVYDSWLDEWGGAPLEWTPVARWKIPHNIVCRDDTVTFYAVEPSESEPLIEHLRAFSRQLPADVGQLGLMNRFPIYAGQRIDFRAEESDQYLWYGWSGREACCRWSNSGRAAVVFALRGFKPDTLRMKVGPFLAPGRLDRQRLQVELNGAQVAALELKERESRVYSIELPEALLRDENILSFTLPDAVSPSALKVSEDTRRLGINLEWLELKAEAEK